MIRKKSILIIIAITLTGLISYLVHNIIIKSKKKNKIARQIHTIPKFEFLTLDNKPFLNINLKKSQNTIFVYFNSECDYCQHEAESISQNLNKFNNVQFVFISTENIEIIKKFSEKYNLNNQLNITFLHDSNFNFTRQFNANSIPFILIYNKNKELIKKHKGQLNANGILRALNQND